MVRTVRPKANATPANPIPRLGKLASNNAAPQPPNTSQNVPMNSAEHFLKRDIETPQAPEMRKDGGTSFFGGTNPQMHHALCIESQYNEGVFIHVKETVNGFIVPGTRSTHIRKR